MVTSQIKTALRRLVPSGPREGMGEAKIVIYVIIIYWEAIYGRRK
jgi:hypothetical protein